MTFEQVRQYYGNGYRFWKSTGMSKTTYSNWKINGKVPYIAQLKIEHATKGTLKADLQQLKDEWDECQKLDKVGAV